MSWRPDYVTAAVMKNYLRIDDALDDALIALWCTTVSRNIDDHCGRQFGNSAGAVERVYSRPVRDRRTGRWWYTIDDVYDTAGLTVTDDDDNVLDVEAFEPDNAIADGVPVQRLALSGSTPGYLIVVETDKWGWADIPASIKIGMMLFGARLAARRDSPFGVAGSPSDGSEIRLLARLDPDMINVLRPFRRRWWAA